MGQALSACTGSEVERTKERAFDFNPLECTPPKGNRNKSNVGDSNDPSPAVVPLKDEDPPPEMIARQDYMPSKPTDLRTEQDDSWDIDSPSESRSPPTVAAEESSLTPSTGETDAQEREGVAETYSGQKENVEPEVKNLSHPPLSMPYQIQGNEELDVFSDKQLKQTKTDDFVPGTKKQMLKDEGASKNVKDTTKSASKPHNSSISTSPTSVTDQISSAGAILSATTKSPSPTTWDQDAQKTLETGEKESVEKESAPSNVATAENLTLYPTEAFHVLCLCSPTVNKNSKTCRSTHKESKQNLMQTPVDSAGANASLCIYPTGKFSVLGLTSQ